MRIFLLLSCFLLWNYACVNDATTSGNIRNEATKTGQKPAAGFSETYESTNRSLWQKPDLIINMLGNLEGKTVADIGAGTGFLSLRIAPKAAKVIAIDIAQNFIDHLDTARLDLPEQFQNHLEPRLTTVDSPNLQAEEADAVLIVNTYMYMQDRQNYLKKLQTGMKPGGKLLIVDFKKKQTPVGPPSDIRIPSFQVERELQEAGFKNLMVNDTALDYQYAVMGEKG